MYVSNLHCKYIAIFQYLMLYICTYLVKGDNTADTTAETEGEHPGSLYDTVV